MDPGFTLPTQERCYACKRGCTAVCSPSGPLPPGGTRVVDRGESRLDLGDHRPGIARPRGAWRWFSPPVELGYRKAAVRQISRAPRLSWWGPNPAQTLPGLYPVFHMESRSCPRGLLAGLSGRRLVAQQGLRENLQGARARAKPARIEVAARSARLAREGGGAQKDLVTAFRQLGFNGREPGSCMGGERHSWNRLVPKKLNPPNPSSHKDPAATGPG